MATELSVSGMTCEGCEAVVEHAVELADGVESVTADRYDGTVSVEGPVERDVVAEKIGLAGYEVTE